MRRRIVITGGTGNVGTALLRRLAAADTDYDVVGIARRKPPATDVYRHARWHQMNLADPKAVTQMQRLFRGADCVVHLAWAFQPTRNLRYLDAVAVGGSSAVLVAAHAANAGQLIYLSSAGVYAPGHGRRVDESWPTSGVPTSAYSQAKSAVEELLDDYDEKGDGVAITRLRPGFIVQRHAAASIRRYAFPAWLDPRWLWLVPFLPLDSSLEVPVIHADDVADACVRAIERRATGAFNLSDEPAVTYRHIASALKAIPVHLPARLMRPVTQASWVARLQPIDPGWLDLALSMPLLDTERARDVLGWRPKWTSRDALAELAQGLLRGAGTQSPVLAPRSLASSIWRDMASGPITRREQS